MTVSSHIAAPDAPEPSLLEAFWRYRRSSFAIIVLFGLAAAAITQFVLVNATATARFAVTDPRSTLFLRQGVSSDSSFISYTAQRAAFAQSADVLAEAAKIIVEEGGPSYTLAQLRAKVTTKSNPDGAIVSVTASAPDGPTAAQIANAVVGAYQRLTAAQITAQQEALVATITAQRKDLERDLARVSSGSGKATALIDALAQLRIKESDASADVTQLGTGTNFVDAADPTALKPSELPRNFAIGIAVGGLFATVVAFLRATSVSAGRSRREQPRLPAEPRRRPRPVRKVESAGAVDLESMLERSTHRTVPEPEGRPAVVAGDRLPPASRAEPVAPRPADVAAPVRSTSGSSARQADNSASAEAVARVPANGKSSSEASEEAPTLMLPALKLPAAPVGKDLSAGGPRPQPLPASKSATATATATTTNAATPNAAAANAAAAATTDKAEVDEAPADDEDAAVPASANKRHPGAPNGKLDPARASAHEILSWVFDVDDDDKDPETADEPQPPPAPDR